MSADAALPMNPGIEVAWFANCTAKLGTPETLPFEDLAWIITDDRRVGEKDGLNFIPTRFAREAGDPPTVRRLAASARARTAICLDIEENKTTGEQPPSAHEITCRLHDRKMAGVVWTTHNHTPDRPRYRVLVPLSHEIAPELPAVEILARRLGVESVFDRSKRGPASLFFLPSTACAEDLDRHESYILQGESYDAASMEQEAGALLTTQQAEQDRLAAEAHAAAQARLEARIAAGFDSADSLIEKIRSHFDLTSVLTSHSYDRRGQKFRHPNSQSGSFGADVKTLGGIERIYSHNAGDPLHRDNLPEWCGVTALDVVDVVTILDFGGDRKRALRELAQRFGLSKREEKRALAALIFRLVENGEPQEVIEAAAFAMGKLLGVPEDVCQVACWVRAQFIHQEAA